MWILLKAEFEYYKVSTYAYLIVFILLVIAFYTWGTDRVASSYPALRSVMILILFALLISRQIKINQEKTDRFYVNLPLALTKIALLRFLYLTSFWVFMLITFLLTCFFSTTGQSNVPVFSDLISLTGVIFIAISVPLIHRDLNIRFDGKNQKIFIGMIYVTIIFLGYAFFMLFFLVKDSIKAFADLMPYKEIITNISSSGLGAAIILLSGIFSLIASSLIFQKRNKYLD